MAGFQDAADLSNWRPDSASLRDLLKPAEAPKPHIQQLTAALNDLASALDADGDALTEFSVDTESMQRRATMPSALSARSFGESHSSGATHVPITAAAPVLQPSPAVLPHNLEPNGSSPAASATNTQHAFLSYQWDVQDQVIKAKEHLTRLNLKCWMDIDGGMKSDIYDSMAEGVQGAACVVCFMTPAYQDSANCKLELKFAQQSGVPIIPVSASKFHTVWLAGNTYRRRYMGAASFRCRLSRGNWQTVVATADGSTPFGWVNFSKEGSTQRPHHCQCCRYRVDQQHVQQWQ